MIYYVAKICSALIVLGLVYLLGSFTSMSWNPAGWGDPLRFITAVLFAWFFVIVERGRGFAPPQE